MRIQWQRRKFGLVLGLGVGLALVPALQAQEPANLAEHFEKAKPLIKQFCFECHSTEVGEGSVDLEQFTALDDLRPASKTWLKVVEVLDTGEMPPEDAQQMTPAQKAELKAFITRFLKNEAQANAGDPGPVVLRRLTNAQYTYTLRDLTGIATLDPAKEFPTDSAAGEGFTNTGAAMVMSPSLLTKYFDAAKGVTEHVALLPDGVRFMQGTSARDFSDETMEKIRKLYGRYTESSEGNQVNLQGIIFNTNGGGRLPVEKYVDYLLQVRELRRANRKYFSPIGLSSKYADVLWKALEEKPETSGPLMSSVRELWNAAEPGKTSPLQARIAPWQNALWRYTSVGQIGKVGGPKAWMEPVSPLAERVEIRQEFKEAKPDENGLVHLYLTVGDAGVSLPADETRWGDVAILENPRLVTPGRPDLPLRDVQKLVQHLTVTRKEALSHAGELLNAAATTPPTDPAAVAAQLKLAPELVGAWYGYLGVGTGPPEIPQEAYFKNKTLKGSGYDFINGFDSPELPSIVANSSDQHVRIPGNMKPKSVAVHPTPTQQVVIGWRSPMTGPVAISGVAQHAPPEGGNGVTWVLELRKGATRQRLAAGVAAGGAPVKIGPFNGQAVNKGDLLTLAIGPRDGNHSCDLTAVDMTITGGDKTWDLAADVSPDILAGNPHHDSHGNTGVWHFYKEADNGQTTDTVIPTGSLLAKWRDAASPDDKKALAQQIQALLTGPAPAADTPDGALHRQISSLRGPLLGRITSAPAGDTKPAPGSSLVGIDADHFGKRGDGSPIDPTSLVVIGANSEFEIALPAELAAGSTFVSGARVVQPAAAAQVLSGLAPIKLTPGPMAGTPVVALPASPTWTNLESDFNSFRQVFPPTLCYTRIVPVDEVVTLTLHYREDHLFKSLMLEDTEAAELDKLWDELKVVSQDPLALADAFQQLLEYATQDADPSVFEPLKKPIADNAMAFRQALIDAEPVQLNSAVAFAGQAYRRPLALHEEAGLRDLYKALRAEDVPHEDAIRLIMARVLVSPEFLYRVEKPGVGPGPGSINAYELASRLSYFLWSSAPDAELLKHAASGDLKEPAVMMKQVKRLLDDPRSRRFAEEFACQWLQVYDFAAHDEKSPTHFPTFAALRPAMYEETIRLFQALFRQNRSVLDLLDSDYTFLNDELAKHYGIDGVEGANWRMVTGVRKHGRGGILGLATTLSKQAGASRTSPILRGNWISEVVLGEKLPRPPKNVPQLPEDEAATEGLTVRQLVEKHSSDSRCASCHVKVDPFGFAMEGYDAIGRFRARDLADRPIDTASKLPDGTQVGGADDLKNYLLTVKRDVFVRQFCRKLLGYALGRSVQLSDDPLLDQMQQALEKHDFQVQAALEVILTSKQFLQIRGAEPSVAAKD